MSDSLVASTILNRKRQDYGLDGDELMFGDFCFTYVPPPQIRATHRSDQFFLHAFLGAEMRRSARPTVLASVEYPIRIARSLRQSFRRRYRPFPSSSNRVNPSALLRPPPSTTARHHRAKVSRNSWNHHRSTSPLWRPSSTMEEHPFRSDSAFPSPTPSHTTRT